MSGHTTRPRLLRYPQVGEQWLETGRDVQGLRPESRQEVMGAQRWRQEWEALDRSTWALQNGLELVCAGWRIKGVAGDSKPGGTGHTRRGKK